MRKAALMAALAAAIAGAGCGSVCGRIAAATDGLNSKGAPCESKKVEAYDVAACERGLSKCSPDDVTQLNAYAECLEKIPVCTAGQELSYGLAQLGCFQPYGKVSGACLNAMR